MCTPIPPRAAAAAESPRSPPRSASLASFSMRPAASCVAFSRSPLNACTNDLLAAPMGLNAFGGTKHTLAHCSSAAWCRPATSASAARGHREGSAPFSRRIASNRLAAR